MNKVNCLIDLMVKSLLVAAALGIAATAGAQQGVELGEGVVVTAEVVAVDRVDRSVTLRGPEGNVVTIEVSHAARNFDQVEIGDQVRVEYFESVVLYLGPHGQKPQAAESLVAARSTKGAKPGGVVVETVDVSATVKSIDRGKRKVTLELADGRMVTSRVDPSLQGFNALKVGDSIHARVTEAVAISVEKP